MSNLHVNLDEANKHTPKGFDNVGNNTRPWKDEQSASTYTENFQLPRAINFVDGTLAAPSNGDGDIFVLTGSGTLHADWGTAAAFQDWVRFTNTIATPITPVAGALCYDDTASSWMEFDGSVWAAFGGGGGGLPSLTDSNFWLGNGSNAATERTMNGDATMNNTGTVTIANDSVSYAKMQNVTDERLLGNFSGGVGDVQEIALSNDLQVLLGVLGLNTTPLYISDITTVNLLDDVANWDLNGNYTGIAITGTFQGQHHVNSTYWFTCTHDNIWIRMARI